MEQDTAQSSELITPWDPKGKDTTDTTFVLPPSLGVSGRIRAPLGLERKETVET